MNKLYGSIKFDPNTIILNSNLSNVLNSNYIEKSCQIYPLHFAQILSPTQLKKPNLNINSRNLTINLKNCPNLISKIYFRFIPFPYFMSPFCFKFGLSFKLILFGLNPNPSFFISIPTIHSKKNLKSLSFPLRPLTLFFSFFPLFLFFSLLFPFFFSLFPQTPHHPSSLSPSFQPCCSSNQHRRLPTIGTSHQQPLTPTPLLLSSISLSFLLLGLFLPIFFLFFPHHHTIPFISFSFSHFFTTTNYGQLHHRSPNTTDVTAIFRLTPPSRTPPLFLPLFPFLSHSLHHVAIPYLIATLTSPPLTSPYYHSTTYRLHVRAHCHNSSSMVLGDNVRIL